MRKSVPIAIWSRSDSYRMRKPGSIYSIADRSACLDRASSFPHVGDWLLSHSHYDPQTNQWTSELMNQWTNEPKKNPPPFYRRGLYSCKPVSRVLYLSRKQKASIINLALPLPAGSSNLPIPATPARRRKYGNEQLRFRDLFGFSTPEVYRNPGRPEKPWALTSRFHPYPGHKD